MKVKKNSLVRIHYRMRVDGGEEIDSSTDGTPLEFICGRGDVIPGLERELIGMLAGQKKTFTIPAEDAYGIHDQGLVRELPRAGFPSDRKLEKGQCFSYRSKQGAELRYRVVEVKDDTIVADFNHPLAGKALQCDVEVLQVFEDGVDALARS
ncbi:MAG: FKBP-type peptidyl-prolyl cis-trans isomerase [Myxococcota bacterium]